MIAEFYLGKRWSVAANWKYSWWKTDRKHWYWRTYGGDFEIRKWFGKLAKEKPAGTAHFSIPFNEGKPRKPKRERFAFLPSLVSDGALACNGIEIS